MTLENTERSRIIETIRDEVMFPRVCRVTSVNAHTSPSDTTNHRVDAEWPPNLAYQEYKEVPVGQPARGITYVPEVGDMVLLSFLNGEGDKPIVVQTVYGSDDADRAPQAQPGERKIKRGDKFVEMHPDGDWVRIVKRASDTGDPDVEIEINDNGIDIMTTDQRVKLEAPSSQVDVKCDEIVTNDGTKIVAHDDDTITGDGHDHGGNVPSDTVTGSIDDKSDGDMKVNK